jgi:predicted lipid-binding transport protein (Tim44 family)
MFGSMMYGMLVLGLGILMLVIGRSFALGPGMLFILLTSLLILGGIGWATYGVLNAVREATLSGTPARQNLSEANDKRLPTNPIPEALPSVTEHTTQLLAPDHPDSADLSRDR